MIGMKGQNRSVRQMKAVRGLCVCVSQVNRGTFSYCTSETSICVCLNDG